uniref:Uncharacterized protein n=1 Tax=viral metagenome TaxID=1070528 RepID=A0A6M3LPR6_9ZZZZ
MAKVYKVWIHVEEIDTTKDHYQECGCPFDMGEFETEDEAWDYAGMLSRCVEDTDELMAAARDVVDMWEHGDLAGAMRRLDAALRGMEVRS